MLTGSILCLLFTDFVYGLAILDGTYAGQVWLDWGWIGYYLLWGAAALHPSMRTLEESAPEKESRLSSTRLIVLTAASLIAPIAETVLQARTADIDSFVMIGASAALFLLVVARMAGMVRQEERSVQRERALREAGLALVAAAGRDEIGTATLQAAQQLTGPAYEARLFSSSDDAARAIAGEPGTRYSEELPLTVRGEPRGELVVDGPVPLTASQRSALRVARHQRVAGAGERRADRGPAPARVGGPLQLAGRALERPDHGRLGRRHGAVPEPVDRARARLPRRRRHRLAVRRVAARP